LGGIETPPYSPDLNPCDYDGIARIKRPNKGRFNTEADLVDAYDAVIDDINEKKCNHWYISPPGTLANRHSTEW
jgi:transposase